MLTQPTMYNMTILVVGFILVVLSIMTYAAGCTVNNIMNLKNDTCNEVSEKFSNFTFYTGMIGAFMMMIGMIVRFLF